jgi:hypothetical protein
LLRTDVSWAVFGVVPDTALILEKPLPGKQVLVIRLLALSVSGKKR